ncbi:MAG: acetyl-CoA carboxylase biotin carboxyl carrier protein [Trueperaceae bacterium]|nr:acetyl-CoA carboxylase biotin carboxyl carrier protein [Trueperaceae bacterium]
MDVKEIKKLLDAMKTAGVSELTLETADVKLSARRGEEARVARAGPDSGGDAPARTQEPPPAPADASSPAAAQAAAPPAPEAGSPLVEVTAPIVGTFYESPGPDAPVYVKVGDRVTPGTVLCIIEAMKLMNEIEAETSGTIAEVLVRNEEPVEYGQTLFRIDPD